MSFTVTYTRTTPSHRAWSMAIITVEADDAYDAEDEALRRLRKDALGLYTVVDVEVMAEAA